MPYEGSGDVYVLADKYGRVLVQHVEDGDYYQAVVWSDTRFDWDSLADPGLLELMNDRGYVEALTIAENLGVTVNIGDETETYVWDTAKAEFDYEFDIWTNGERTLALKWFPRENGNPFCAVVDDNSGGPITWEDQSGQSRCLVLLNPGDETPEFSFGLLSQYPELEHDVAGLYEVTCYESPVPDHIGVNTIIDETDENIFVINISDDGAYTESSSRLPSVPEPIPIAVDGAVQVFNDPFCTEYFDGVARTCYVRLNRAFNVEKEWREGAKQLLSIATPIEEDPDIPYLVLYYNPIWRSAGYSQAFKAGQVIKCESNNSDTISNPVTIFRDSI